MTKRDDLRHYVESFIRNEQDRVAAVRLFPTMVRFRLALSRTQKCGQYGHKSFECRSGWNRGQDWGSWDSYSSCSGGQARWGRWNWRQGYQGMGWVDEWGRSTASGSAAPPPEPAQPPATAASSSGSTPMPDSVADVTPAPASESTAAAPVTERPQQELRTALIRSEEYCEIDGIPHFKRTFTDGTVEYEPW